MSFLKSSFSFTRLKITDPVPQDLWPKVIEKLRQYSFKDIDEIPEERSYGWVSFEDMLDVGFAAFPVEKAEYVTFSLRLDTRRVPPGVIKKHLAVAIKNEEEKAREMGRKFVSRERKKELKEQVILRLRMRFLPIPAEFQVIWNTAKSIVYFASTQSKIVELFKTCFTSTFDLHLEPLTPYELASHLLKETASLDALEASRFA